MIKIFADGADINSIKNLCKNEMIKGFTTNPSLMRKAGVSNYESFARETLEIVSGMPISFEIFADDFKEMEQQALKISSWGRNVFVKIPIMNTKGESTTGLIKKLSDRGVQINVTAVFTITQAREAVNSFNPEVPAYLSVFAGRIADTGVDPLPTMIDSLKIINEHKKHELIWASSRELYNIVQADHIGCHIMTIPIAMINNLNFLGRNLEDCSLDTVKTFYNDAKSAGYAI